MTADEDLSNERGDDGPRDPGRRAFLKAAAIAAGATSVGVAARPAPRARADPLVDQIAEEHAQDRAMLVDLTRCVGCGRCVQACKIENDLAWREDQPAIGEDAALASANWTVVRSYGPLGEDGEPRFAKRQCLHCLDPACTSACFVKALRKDENGMVTYDPDLCVGCRYCLVACPFGVPTFEWDETFGRISKCDLCDERAERGRPTACAEACPVGAITFGTRQALLDEAHRRIAADRRKYVNHVYGEIEAGGTSVMYVSDIPFEELGFPDGVPTTPLPWYTWQVSRLVPPVAGSLASLWIALYLRRRRALLEEADERDVVDSEVAR